MNETYGKAGLARNLLRAALAVDGFVLCFVLCAATNNNGGLAWLLLMFLASLTGLALWYATKQGYWFVRRIERTWKQVCAGLGGNFVGEGKDYVASVREGIRSRGRYYVATQTKVIYPQLKNIRGDHQAFTAEVRFFDGQTLDDYNQHAQAFAMAFNVPYASFELADNGLILVRCGPTQVPEKFEYPVERLAELVPATTDVAAVLKAVPMARDIAGRPWVMPIEENHLLIAGRSGSGKNSWSWSLVFGLAEARKAGVVRLWGLDPKKVELAFGREWWDEYADTVEGMVELLEKAVNDLLERNKQIQGKARKITPNPDMPLNVLIIDELAYLSALVPDKKLKDRAQSAIGTILLLGRATGYVLTACTQDVRKEVIGFRDYFPTKVALGMPAPMVDLCLGEGAWENGAKAEQIPLREAGAGCAYVLEETSNKPLLVRAAWCSDEAIRMMLANPQAFGVAFDEPLQQYQQGYTGVDTSTQLGFDGRPLDAGQPAPPHLRWEDLPPEVRRLALQYAQQWQHQQD